MKIEKLDNYGRGITYLDNKITFVKDALKDEEVDIEVINQNKKFNEAKVVKYNKKSDKRVLPKCPYYDTCGGCSIMHMDFTSQDDFKINKVKEVLKKYANIEQDIKYIKSDKQLFYRNKITLKVENNNIGYYNESTHNLVSIKSCLLASNSINNVINNLDFIEINNGEIIIRSNYEDKILIIVKSLEKVKVRTELIPEYVIGIVVNDKTVYKNNYFIDMIGNYKYRLSYNSFFQINNYVASRIFEILNSNLKGENLLDLYCGVGTLGISLKNNYKNIYGIEIVNNAIKDAKYNATINKVKHSFYYAGDSGKILKKLNVAFDTVLLDPPRSGLNKETIKLVSEIKPNQIAYVSCDIFSLSRDLKMLNENYNIKKIYALDMFPNTYHCESVIILERK